MADSKDTLIPQDRMEEMSVAPGDPKAEGSKHDSAKHDGPAGKGEKAKDAPRDEDNLEEGLEGSMAGSDPASSTQP